MGIPTLFMPRVSIVGFGFQKYCYSYSSLLILILNFNVGSVSKLIHYVKFLDYKLLVSKAGMPPDRDE